MILSFASLASLSINALSSRAFASSASFSLFICAISALTFSAVANELAIDSSLCFKAFNI
jgi:hypothetical protein